MEIYSPKSKSKSLFKKNQFKLSESSEQCNENSTENKEYIRNAKLVRKEDSFLIRIKNVVAKRVLDFFQVDEAV